MIKTKYYDLQMDDPQDDYDVEVVNANLKKIDEQMKTRENATDALQEPEFTVADKRENIASKEKMPKILGKIAKYFTDLKKVAFTGDYADLTNKPTYGKEFTTDKSGSITINLDGETITLDQAKNVIKLADTLKDKIGEAFPSANVANNQVTTEAGFALDARQANPNIDGTLAKQVADLNGSLNLCVKQFTIPVNESIAIPCLNCIIFHDGNNGGKYSIVTTVGYASDTVRSRISYINGDVSNGLKLSYSGEETLDSKKGIFIIENTNPVNSAHIAVIGIKNFSKM